MKRAHDTAWVIVAPHNMICYGTYPTRRAALASAVKPRHDDTPLSDAERAHWRRMKDVGYRATRVRITEIVK